jgi:hypothetical protein
MIVVLEDANALRLAQFRHAWPFAYAGVWDLGEFFAFAAETFEPAFWTALG